jgi:hypothetical protein
MGQRRVEQDGAELLDLGRVAASGRVEAKAEQGAHLPGTRRQSR